MLLHYNVCASLQNYMEEFTYWMRKPFVIITPFLFVMATGQFIKVNKETNVCSYYRFPLFSLRSSDSSVFLCRIGLGI